ncbi:MAG: site-specific integrase [Clostridia bacterium]|nr:site-specific integrase [Clostridia bacterium]
MDKRMLGSVRKLSEGKYLLRLSCGFDDFGKRVQISKTVYCKNDVEAEKLLADFYAEREYVQSARAAGVPKTLGELYVEWTENHVKTLAAATQKFYSDLWDKRLFDKTKIKLAAITPKHIYKILGEIEQPRTRNAVFMMLKAMFNRAVKWGYMVDNPCNRVETPKYKAVEKDCLRPEDIKRITSVIGKQSAKYQAIFYFAAVCGLRRQEIAGLQWGDVDFANDCFVVQRATTAAQGGTVAKETKTDNSRRKLFLHKVLKDALFAWKDEQAEIKCKVGDKWKDGDWIFTQNNGDIINLHTISNWWKDFARANGITQITFHGLRHTAASYMIRNNVPVSTVSKVLGHANTTTTLNIYTHVIENTKESAVSVMGDMFADE